MIWTFSQVALGGAIGAVLRHASNLAAIRLYGVGFPVSTLFVNVAGSFLMGVLVSALALRGGMHLAPFLLTGILGGFTTFSAFSLDAVTLWDQGETLTAAVYVVVSVAASILALVLGGLLARAVMG
jgi:CrcB protein